MIIRKAETKDILEINNLFTQSDNFHFENDSYIYKESKDTTRSVEYINGLITQTNAIFLVLEIKTKVIGFIYGFEETKGFLPIHNSRRYFYIDNIVVKSEEQRKGYGKVLIKEIIKIAKKYQYNDIILNVYSFNTFAIKIYNDLGFKPLTQDMILKLN